MEEAPMQKIEQSEPSDAPKKKGFWHKFKEVGGAIVGALVNGIAKEDNLGGDD